MKADRTTNWREKGKLTFLTIFCCCQDLRIMTVAARGLKKVDWCLLSSSVWRYLFEFSASLRGKAFVFNFWFSEWYWGGGGRRRERTWEGGRKEGAGGEGEGKRWKRYHHFKMNLFTEKYLRLFTYIFILLEGVGRKRWLFSNQLLTHEHHISVILSL